MVYQVMTLAAVGVGAYLLYQWFKQAGATHEASFREGVFHDVATWMAPHVGASTTELVPALRALVENGVSSPLLTGLREIECEVTKLNPTTARRTIIVLLDRGDGQGTVGRLSCELGWDDLPDHIRAEFIRSAEQTQTFRILASRTRTPEGKT